MNHAADNEALLSCFRRIFDDDDIWIKLPVYVIRAA